MKKKEICIIKLGAMGDVVRTTTLLRVLNGDVYWVTKTECIPLLPTNSSILKRIVEVDGAEKNLSENDFDLVLSLDDDFEAAKLATILNKTELIGSYLDSDNKLRYTDSATEWFDLGLISKFGKGKADEVKKNNNKTYQEIIFRMIGREFKGEEYLLNFEDKPNNANKKSRKKLIGIECRASERWPTKNWNKYSQLGDLLVKDGFEVKFFQQRGRVNQYISDINECEIVVTGDTLALHIALALKIKAVAIFTCTSPTEIFDYGRLIKVVSPLWEDAFYTKEYKQEAVNAISLDSVYKAVISLSGKCPAMLPL